MVFLYDIRMVSITALQCVLLAYSLTMAVNAESTEGEPAAMILEHRWAKFRNLPQFNIDQDPIRKNLGHGALQKPPSSCYYYLIDKSCPSGAGPIEKSLVCVECSSPSLCQGKNSAYFSLLLREGCRGRWTLIGDQKSCSCDITGQNYIFV